MPRSNVQQTTGTRGATGPTGPTGATGATGTSAPKVYSTSVAGDATVTAAAGVQTLLTLTFTPTSSKVRLTFTCCGDNNSATPKETFFFITNNANALQIDENGHVLESSYATQLGITDSTTIDGIYAVAPNVAITLKVRWSAQAGTSQILTDGGTGTDRGSFVVQEVS